MFNVCVYVYMCMRSISSSGCPPWQAEWEPDSRPLWLRRRATIILYYIILNPRRAAHPGRPSGSPTRGPCGCAVGRLLYYILSITCCHPHSRADPASESGRERSRSAPRSGRFISLYCVGVVAAALATRLVGTQNTLRRGLGFLRKPKHP